LAIRLSEEKKYEILAAYKQHKNAVKVARICGVHPKTVRMWVKRHAEVRSMAARKSTGRKKALTHEAAALAVDMLLDKNFGTTSAVAEELHKQGKTSAQSQHIVRLWQKQPGQQQLQLGSLSKFTGADL
jgi:transposase-like protein